VSVVDPGVGTARKSCVARLKNGSFVVTPDNGALTYVKEKLGITEVREIDERVNRYPTTRDIHIFHGRDVYAYCAARLASGAIDFEGVGPAYPVEEIVMAPYLRPRAEGGVVLGMIGASTNIAVDDFEKTGINLGDHARVRIVKDGKTLFDEAVLYHRSFGYVPVGAPILYNGSTSPYIALSLNQRSFAQKYLPDIFNTGEDFADYKVFINKA